jgi:uridine kinase
MRGDKILIEEHHINAAKKIVEMLLPQIPASKGKYTITVAGESGSGKSETAAALANAFEEKGIKSIIFQQDDYYVYPPKTNDKTRRKDINWVGTQEVRLDVLDQNLHDFLDGKNEIEKPLVLYEEDRIDKEILPVDEATIAIAEGTYTTELKNVNTRVFIDRNYFDTRAHREKRARYQAELDEFTENVLRTEHKIVSSHKAKADIIITKDYEVTKRS